MTPAAIERVRHAMTLHRSGEYRTAAAIYREMLGTYPGHSDLIHYLGMAEYKLGNTERARELFRESLARNATKAIVHVNLGRTYLNERDYDTALEHFKRALGVDPRDAEAIHMLGRALLGAGHPHEAVIQLERGVAVYPDRSEILLDLAHSYARCQRHPQAVECFRTVLKKEPRNAEALAGLSASLRVMNQAPEALDCLRSALKLNPDDPRWQCELGALQEELGDFAEAESIFRATFKRRPAYPVAVAHLLALRKGLEDPSLVKKALEHLSANEIAKPIRVQLEFALGKHFDASKDYDHAFAHYRAANELVAEGHRYRPLALETHASRLIATFDRALFERKRHLGHPSERPVFIVGMPRSGTTLTEQILASHREVAGAGELGYFNYQAFVLAQQHSDTEDLTSYARELDGEALARCAAGYLQHHEATPSEARRVVDKMPMNFLQVGLIALTFPNARIIHCRRDPMDTCLSCYFENFHEDQRYSTRLESLGHYYRQYARLMKHWSQALDVPPLEVQYEETVSDIEGQARRLVDFCGLEWDENCLAFHRTERAVCTPSRWQVRQPIYNSSVGRWRRYEKYLEPLQQALESR